MMETGSGGRYRNLATPWRGGDVTARGRLAADIGEQTGLRSLDALHLGAAARLGPAVVSVLTYDIRQAQAARHLGFVVLGV